MTYSKAPEFVRMVQLILGKVKFVRALENYHQKFAFSNAKTDDWIACMAEFAPSSIDLTQMATGWLRRTGYPTVTVSSSNYDSATGKYTVDLIQSGYEDQKEETNQYPWIVPVKYSLIKNGVALKNDVVILNANGFKGFNVRSRQLLFCPCSFKCCRTTLV